MVLLPRLLEGSAYYWDVERTAPGGMSASDYLLGILLTAALPATVWCSAIKTAAWAIGYPLSWSIIGCIGLAISFFLGGIYTCIVRNF